MKNKRSASELEARRRAFGDATDLWTTRLLEVIAERYGVRFNSNYLAGA